jgi:hypothetical protein
VELNKRFIIGYEKYKDEPRVIALKGKVAEYNKLLQYMGLRDHQVRPSWRGDGVLTFCRRSRRPTSRYGAALSCLFTGRSSSQAGVWSLCLASSSTRLCSSPA